MARYKVFYFVMDDTNLIASTQESISALQQRIDDEKISKDDRKKIKSILSEYQYFTMQLYDDDGTYYLDHMSPLEEEVYIETSSLMLSLYYPEYEFYQLQFYDGTYNLTVYSYHGVWFMEVYIIISIILCVILFILLVSYFVQKKVKLILQLRTEMKLIENGDFDHELQLEGNDELGDLGKQVQHLKCVLKENLKSEQEAKEANHELVTAMSHDLRTPLTSLLGYLDILSMKIYKDEEQLDMYIQKSKAKAEQIKEMSDRLFTHFLVYAHDEEVNLRKVDENHMNAIIESFASDVIDLNLQVDFHLSEEQFFIEVEDSLLKRVYDNALSNLRKYAKSYARISSVVEKDALKIRIVNDIKEDTSHVESSKIGLKSMKKMLAYMHANIKAYPQGEEFVMEFTFPLCH